jgi:hypothetical protein
MSSSTEHVPIPQYRCHKDKGDLIEVLDGRTPIHLLRIPKPYDQSFPMGDGIYDLVQNHPGHKYEWCYVRRQEAST